MGKGCSLKPENEDQRAAVFQINRILNKVLILTLCYEIAAIIPTIIGQFGESMIMRILFGYSFTLTSVIINYSMFLMQPHNKTEYGNFLKILHKFKCNYYICCCCK